MNTLNRLAENAAGTWFTTDDCIGCHLCGETAPEIFRPSDDGVFHIVFRQPQSPEEIDLAGVAMRDCPAEAIHCAVDET